MENADGDGKPGAGQGGPALKGFSGDGKERDQVCEKGDESALAELTAGERAANPG